MKTKKVDEFMPSPLKIMYAEEELPRTQEMVREVGLRACREWCKMTFMVVCPEIF